ncbi:hypothetical protein GOV07_04005, partial [Candidatus Woesearchaeota archaeon]|nr:hypothetical protein [Candidatus Woesearchaeota archaeon]
MKETTLQDVLVSYDVEAFNKLYSKISVQIKPYFVIDGRNWWDALSYLLIHTSAYFEEVIGLDITLCTIERLKTVNAKRLRFTGQYAEGIARIAKLIKPNTRIEVRRKRRRFSFLYYNPFWVRNLLRARFFIRYLIGLFRRVLFRTNKKPVDTLFLTNTRFSAKDERDNQLFGPVVQALNKRKVPNKMLRYETLVSTENLTRFIKSFMLQKEAYLGDYYSLKYFWRCHCDFRRLRKRWREVRNDKDFQAIFTHKGHDFFPVIEKRFELIFSALSLIAIDAMHITERVIEKEPYKLLVIDHEDNLYGKCFMLNARERKDKKTLALAHELILPGCIHTHVKNKTVLNRQSPLWRPLPDVKCVWGASAKSILLDSCNYHSYPIKVTGNPKFDRILN